MKYSVFTLIIMVMHNLSMSQKQANIWYFGTTGDGLDFSGGDPILRSGSLVAVHQMRAVAGCTSLSDDEGRLLFYTNGGSTIPGNNVMGGLWNRRHFRMKGSEDFFSGVIGSSNSRQAAISFLKPGSEDTYCLFTIESTLIFANNDDSRGLTYSVIDMTRNQGLGEVVLSGETISTSVIESMAATQHQNGIDYWLVATRYDFLRDSFEGFEAFLITENGVESSVISLENEVIIGDLKLSPDGSVLLGESGGLFQFDSETGELGEMNNTEEIFIQDGIFPMAFSPNSQFLYGFDSLRNIIQFDLMAPDIYESKVVVSELSPDRDIDIEDMQIGPNGKIYMINEEKPQQEVSISVINCPNLKGEACNVQHKIFSLPHTTDIEFPEYTDHIFAYGGPLFLDLGPDTTLCPGDSLLLSPHAGSVDYLWSDGSLGNSLLITQPGWYWVEASNECGTVRDSIWVRGVDNASLDLGADTTICEGETFIISPLLSGNYAYSNFLWQDSSSAATFIADQDQAYSLSVDYQCGTLRDSVRISLEDCSCQVFLPNAFTPNDDGVNDVFSPITACELTTYSLTIFNRWGNQIFTSAQLENRWRGENVAQGVYVWMLNYQYVDQQERLQSVRRQGTVTLLR